MDIDDILMALTTLETGHFPRTALEAAIGQREAITVVHPARAPLPSEKIKRNEPCPCGSGKKYKQYCCFDKF